MPPLRGGARSLQRLCSIFSQPSAAARLAANPQAAARGSDGSPGPGRGRSGPCGAGSCGRRRDYHAGQPTPETHPHLLRPGELTVGIATKEYAARRSALMAALPPGSLAVVPGAELAYMAGVIPYRFRQCVDFYYLTGVNAPGAIALLESPPGGSSRGDVHYTLFLQPRDAPAERWNGPRADAEAGPRFFGATAGHTIDRAPELITAALRRLPPGGRLAVDALSPWMAGLVRAVPALKEAHASGLAVPLRPLTHLLRWRKSPAELALMAHAADVAARAIGTCMSLSRGDTPARGPTGAGPAGGVAEWTLAASFEHSCRSAGADRMAYPPVVGGGPNATHVHYGIIDQITSPGALLLMDAGCELRGYVSDVTRTWPVGGRFSAAQRAVYEVVLETHRACLDAARPGGSLRELHGLALLKLAEGLVDLGVCRPSAARGQVHKYFPHALGHWLGLDTHDGPTVAHERPLEPGVVLTVEPGLYFGEDDEAVPRALRGIGVRIEDDVAIIDPVGPGGGADGVGGTRPGCWVLSAAVPTDLASVEEAVQRGEGHARRV